MISGMPSTTRELLRGSGGLTRSASNRFLLHPASCWGPCTMPGGSALRRASNGGPAAVAAVGKLSERFTLHPVRTCQIADMAQLQTWPGL